MHHLISDGDVEVVAVRHLGRAVASMAPTAKVTGQLDAVARGSVAPVSRNPRLNAPCLTPSIALATQPAWVAVLSSTACHLPSEAQGAIGAPAAVVGSTWSTQLKVRAAGTFCKKQAVRLPHACCSQAR